AVHSEPSGYGLHWLAAHVPMSPRCAVFSAISTLVPRHSSSSTQAVVGGFCTWHCQLMPSQYSPTGQSSNESALRVRTRHEPSVYANRQKQSRGRGKQTSESNINV